MVEFFGRIVFIVVGIFAVLCVFIGIGDLIDYITLAIKKHKHNKFKEIWVCQN